MPAIGTTRYAALTDIGLKRKKNEDAFAVIGANGGRDPEKRTDALFVVADGIGGNACGDVASEMACRGFSGFFETTAGENTPDRYAERIEKLIRSVDTQIRERAGAEPACLDMGTTLSALVIAGKLFLTAHVGDSRIYRLRNGGLRQLTTDHTFVQEMIEEGELTPQRAKTHPLRNMLTRAVGTQEPLEMVDIDTGSVLAGDRFLISSDGLHDMVDEDGIAAALKNAVAPETTAELLLRHALENGGRDNITIIAVFV